MFSVKQVGKTLVTRTAGTKVRSSSEKLGCSSCEEFHCGSRASRLSADAGTAGRACRMAASFRPWSMLRAGRCVRCGAASPEVHLLRDAGRGLGLRNSPRKARRRLCETELRDADGAIPIPAPPRRSPPTVSRVASSSAPSRTSTRCDPLPRARLAARAPLRRIPPQTLKPKTRSTSQL